jgi:hypothetical protein
MKGKHPPPSYLHFVKPGDIVENWDTPPNADT